MNKTAHSSATLTATLMVIVSIALAAAACGGGNSLERGGETISRETFVETYVALRLEGLQSRRTEITLDKQREVLDSLGVTEEDMLAFVEYWGDTPDVMLGIWEEVDSILVEKRAASGLELEPDADLLQRSGDEGGSPPDPRGGREGANGQGSAGTSGTEGGGS